MYTLMYFNPFKFLVFLFYASQSSPKLEIYCEILLESNLNFLILASLP